MSEQDFFEERSERNKLLHTLWALEENHQGREDPKTLGNEIYGLEEEAYNTLSQDVGSYVLEILSEEHDLEDAEDKANYAVGMVLIGNIGEAAETVGEEFYEKFSEGETY